jgi:hypothetical protein
MGGEEMRTGFREGNMKEIYYFGRYRHRWRYNIIKNLAEGLESMDCICLA